MSLSPVGYRAQDLRGAKQHESHQEENGKANEALVCDATVTRARWMSCCRLAMNVGTPSRKESNVTFWFGEDWYGSVQIRNDLIYEISYTNGGPRPSENHFA